VGLRLLGRAALQTVAAKGYWVRLLGCLGIGLADWGLGLVGWMGTWVSGLGRENLG
jgi:hypothetical protein